MGLKELDEPSTATGFGQTPLRFSMGVPVADFLHQSSMLAVRSTHSQHAIVQPVFPLAVHIGDLWAVHDMDITRNPPAVALTLFQNVVHSLCHPRLLNLDSGLQRKRSDDGDRSVTGSDAGLGDRVEATVVRTTTASNATAISTGVATTAAAAVASLAGAAAAEAAVRD